MGRAKIKAPDTLFLPCQAKWIKDQSRMKIAEKARQIGFTWCSSYADMKDTARENNHIDTWITSRDTLQAKLYIQDCLNWAKIFGLVAKDMGEQVLLDEGGKKQSAQYYDAPMNKSSIPCPQTATPRRASAATGAPMNSP